MKGCELCKYSVARMYCESDEACLCCDCDSKVHSANFLVAKHSRTLLCRLCQSPTPWTASGPKLGPTVSLCHSCFINTTNDNDDEDNQVVPRSSPPLPVSTSSSSTDEPSSSCRLRQSTTSFSLKRTPQNADLSTHHRVQNDPGCSSSSQKGHREAASFGALIKKHKRTVTTRSSSHSQGNAEAESRSKAVVHRVSISRDSSEERSTTIYSRSLQTKQVRLI